MTVSDTRATTGETVILANAQIALTIDLTDRGPLLAVGLVGKPGVLRRLAEGPDVACGGHAWHLSVSRAEDGAQDASLVLRGDPTFALNVRIPATGNWVEVTESVSRKHGLLAPIEAFESTWRFDDGSQVHEVFSPNLAPEPDDLIGGHMFRSPVLVVEGSAAGAAIAVDVLAGHASAALPGALDLLRQGTNAVELSVGVRAQRVRGHVFHERAGAPVDVACALLSHRYLIGITRTVTHGDALRSARSKVWELAAAAAHSLPLSLSPATFARQIYPPTLKRLWGSAKLGSQTVGAVTLNRSYASDVWFSTWMNPLRSSYGLFYFGQALGNDDWVERARSTRALAQAAPMVGGLFPTVFVFKGQRWVGSHHQGGGPGVYHLADMSWTMYQLLRWHDDLEKDEQTITRALEYARAVVRLQRKTDGGLPAYVDAHGDVVSHIDGAALARDLAGGGGDPYLTDTLPQWGDERFVESSEDGVSLLFLAELAHALAVDSPERASVLTSARQIARYLETDIIPSARWIDFETYFSCSVKRLDFYDARSGQSPQNSLSMHHAAAGFLRLFEVTGDEGLLQSARRIMDRLSLYQQAWSPPWLSLTAIGGYGVMNTDGEWNDARQSQIAETHLDFARVTGEVEHYERAIAAARAGLTTTFLPANADRYVGWWREPQGMAAENHGHAGQDSLNGVSGFDWGSGSALATVAYFDRRGIRL